MIKQFSKTKSPLFAKQELLLQQEKALRQEEKLLRRRLRDLPVAMEETHQPYYIHRKVVIRTMLTADYQRTTGLLFPGAFSRSRLLPIRERKTAKIKFVVLVCILAAIVTLIWRSIPT